MTKIKEIKYQGYLYKGDLKNGIPHGKGFFYKSNPPKDNERPLKLVGIDYNEIDFTKDEYRTLYYEGEVKKGKPNGKGIFYYYNCNWMRDGNPENVKNIYKGEVKDGKKHGKGKMFYYETEVISELIENKIDHDFFDENEWDEICPGYMFPCDHDEDLGIYLKHIYIGEWQNDKRHGKGKLKLNQYRVKNSIYGTGETIMYDGEWKNDLKHGQGSETFQEIDMGLSPEEYNRLEWEPFYKATYVGGWKNGKRNGKGTLTLPDGLKQEGMWHEGKFVEIDESKKN